VTTPRKKITGIAVSIIAAPFVIAVVLALLIGLVLIPFDVWRWILIVGGGVVVWSSLSIAIYHVFFDEER
jgi:MFS family permease